MKHSESTALHSDTGLSGGRRTRLAASLALALALLPGCRATPARLGPIPGDAVPAAREDEPYRVLPGDELEFHFFHTPERNLSVLVRPDGFVALPLVNELEVAGRTPEDIRVELVRRYSQELAEPEVAVLVRSFARYLVHVGGEVDSPGVLEVRPSSTVLEAVFEAGGLLPSASPRDALVVRRLEGGGYELIGADIDAVLMGRDAAGNFALRPYDIVYVPHKRIVDVNRWVDMYIRQNIPLTFSYRIDS